MTLARKHSKYNVSQQFVEMLLLQNKPWLVRYKKIRALSVLPSVECGKFKSKQAFQSGKILACSSDVVKTLMVETETKTKTWKKFETKTRDQDWKKFSRPRSRLGEFVRDRDETSRPEILKAILIRIDSGA